MLTIRRATLREKWYWHAFRSPAIRTYRRDELGDARPLPPLQEPQNERLLGSGTQPLMQPQGARYRYYVSFAPA
jgi:hypothetical protein